MTVADLIRELQQMPQHLRVTRPFFLNRDEEEDNYLPDGYDELADAKVEGPRVVLYFDD